MNSRKARCWAQSLGRAVRRRVHDIVRRRRRASGAFGVTFAKSLRRAVQSAQGAGSPDNLDRQRDAARGYDRAPLQAGPLVWMFVAALSLISCGRLRPPPPPPPPPGASGAAAAHTAVPATEPKVSAGITQIMASPDANPDSTGRPSPVVVRVCAQLQGRRRRSSRSEFFALFDDERKRWDRISIGRDEYALAPAGVAPSTWPSRATRNSSGPSPRFAIFAMRSGARSCRLRSRDSRLPSSAQKSCCLCRINK